ncbi:outer membrane beta-barrel protein [Bergeyella zoohelcum]|uniref:Outer membrane protein beta-barrel domain-containing protein n=1 Tax=Bergeyella zoohelcum TaxID=1015 RepID=A0A376BY61_9FLAO|nr:outer membrane beta-barrel protein [Bergeyella zoohelcum]EKB61441.1 hypothetical protein HMPREF9700_00936 [Bergeyella zoohelcum CCUG 30536]SSZ46467.1 Uncharacterised protein [Bergeyella zoohelcum]
MKQLIAVLTFGIFSLSFGQNIPESKLLIGAETGININVSDYENDTKKVSLQGGLLAEYLLNKNFSLIGKVKYYQSEVIFTYSEIIGSGMFGNHYNFITSSYNGKIISIPITFNYNFKIYKNISGSLRLGPSFNSEISSDYNYPTSVNKDYSKFFVGISGGINLNYNTENKVYFIGFEPMFGVARGKTSGQDLDGKNQTQRYNMENYLINVGMKFRIK